MELTRHFSHSTTSSALSASNANSPATVYFFFSSRRRHTRSLRDWSSDVCSSDLQGDAEKKMCLRVFRGVEHGLREVRVRGVEFPLLISRGAEQQPCSRIFGISLDDLLEQTLDRKSVV